ncbi:MAG: hypothetical protein LBQ57_08220 [Spirochaetales bacterium]|nr:hypothetical protein [Spirochaetales bacterium]
MKRRFGFAAGLLSLVLGLMVLAGCDSGTDDDNITIAERDYSYEFKDNGTYEKFYTAEGGAGVAIDGGSYIVKDNVLFLLRNYNYASADAVSGAVEKYTLTKNADSISLSSGQVRTVYSLHGSVPESRTFADNFAGKKLKSGPSAMDMWNVWDFKNDGTFEFTHYHSEHHHEGRGTYSYLVQGNFLVTVAPNTASSPYAVSVYAFSGDGPFTLTPTPAGGNAVYTAYE